jgi:hypothetical protein
MRPSGPLLMTPVVTHSVTQLLETLCLQNTPGLSDSIAHLGAELHAHLPGSARAGSCCGQPWWSAPVATASLLDGPLIAVSQSKLPRG